MRFQPDIVVVSPNQVGPTVVVEVRATRDPSSRAEAASALRRYMQGVGASVGLLVTPACISMLRDTFRTNDPSSIDVVYDGAVSLPWSKSAQESGASLERAVLDWLESLRLKFVRDSLPSALREAAELHLLPLLEEGTVRAARVFDMRRVG